MGERDSTPEAGSPGDPEVEDAPVLRSTRLPAASTAALQSSIADQAARTQELREALDQLRTTLEARPDGPPRDPEPAPRPPTARPPTARRRNPRRLVVALAAGALAVAVAVTVAVAHGSSVTRGAVEPSPSEPPESGAAPGSPGGSGSPAATGSGEPGAAASPPRPATPAPSAPGGSSAVLTTRPLPWPGGPVLEPPGLPVTGPGVDVPGLEVTAALDPDRRHVDVYERVLLRPGVTTLHLAPASLAALPRVLRGARPAVTELQVEIDGRAVPPLAGRTGWQVTPGGATIDRAVLRYRVMGALVRQTPAPPGRATLILTPLAGGTVTATQDPVVVRIDDQRVGAMYCPTARHPTCASAAGRTHTATVPWDATAVVLAQVDGLR
ncbi:MAG: hypothetical protein ACXV1K_07370 [Kineosporiaceae bacterium]